MASSNVPNPIPIFVSGTIALTKRNISSSLTDINGDDAAEVAALGDLMGLAKQIIPYSRGTNGACTLHVWVEDGGSKMWAGQLDMDATTARGRVLDLAGDPAIFYFREYDPTNDLRGRILNASSRVYVQIEGSMTDGFDVSPEIHRLSYVDGLKEQQ